MPSSTQIHRAVPVIGTEDIQKSISYYIDVLGFLFDFKYGEPAVYAGVKSGSAEIYFTHDPHLAKIIKEQKLNPEVFIWIPDAIHLFKKHVDKGAEIFEPLSDRSWGSRQYVIREINGYHLKFAQAL
jgi:catechol 2,3-dioxygenase-like lactoylglutathione lyase family enzyme